MHYAHFRIISDKEYAKIKKYAYHLPMFLVHMHIIHELQQRAILLAAGIELMALAVKLH